MKTFFAFSFSPDEDNVETGRFFLRLTKFTVNWGLLGMIFALLLIMLDLDPDILGYKIAFCLFSILYAFGFALFVFFPIGIRLSPSELHRSSCWLAIRLSLTGLAIFFIVRFIFVLITLAIITPDRPMEPVQPNEIGFVVQQTFLTFLPGDPEGNVLPHLHRWGFDMIWFFYDLPSLILVVGGWWIFRMASGRRRRWIAAPVIILIGIFWSIVGFALILSDLDPNSLGASFAVAILTTLYAFIGAAGFLIMDVRHAFKEVPNDSPSSDLRAATDTVPPAEGMEQAKEIIDRVVERERR